MSVHNLLKWQRLGQTRWVIQNSDHTTWHNSYFATLFSKIRFKYKLVIILLEYIHA